MIWLVLLAFSFACGLEEVPKIIMDAEDYYGFPDKFSYLRVQTNTAAGATFHWLRDGVEITKDTTPPFSQFDSKILVPTNQGKEYAGIYQIVMTAKAGTIKGRKVTVDFIYLGSFDTNLPPSYKPKVIVGQANFVKCPKHEAGSRVIYRWGKPSVIIGIKFMESKPNYIVLDDGTLFYSHLKEDDVTVFNQNSWTCVMEGKMGDVIKLQLPVNIKTQLNKTDTNMTTFGPKIVTTLPKNKRFQEGHAITMKCAAAGRPTPLYSWKRIDVYDEEHAVKNGVDGITFDYGDPRLLAIKSASRKHAGRYFCTATIGDKNDTVEGSLIFGVQPTWIGKSIETVSPSIYSNHSWTCNATGFPTPAYEWYQNGVKLAGSATRKINGGTLTFSILAKTDTGMYQCFADNGLDNIYQSAHLDVQAEKPFFDTNTGKTTLFLGAIEGVIKCHAEAAPYAKNTWRKDGVDIDFSLSRYTLVNNEDLVIASVSKQDVGNYTCKAENEFGMDSKKISVQVVGEITFIAEPQDKTTTRGSRIILKCQAEGDKSSPIKATIKYKWKYNGKDIQLNDSFVWSEDAHSLVFLRTQVGQSGVYECIAYTDKPSYVEKRSRAKVVIRAPTTPPPDPCMVTKRNIMFLVDGSGSVPVATFGEFKKFMSFLVEKFDIGPNTTHLGVLQYSTKRRTGLEFYFTEHQTLAAVQNAISKVRYHYGAYTFGGYAMNLAQQIMNHYDRADAKNVWVLLMDNGLWDKTMARKISRAIRQAGTKVIVLDTENIMHDIADKGLDFSSENLAENVEAVRKEICK